MRFLAVFPILFICNLCFSQDADSTTVRSDEQDGTITASVQFDRNDVPQNRNLVFTVKVSWQGDLDRFEIEKLENPILTNFRILSNSSSNRVGQAGGVKQAVKTYEFTLQPLELGMAYADGMIIEYVDMKSGKKGHLLTNRLEAKVIDPIKERSLKPWIIGGGVVVTLLLLGGGRVYFAKRKKAREAADNAKALESIPIEEKYLPELKENVDLQGGDQIGSFSSLSKLFRSYLSERYDMPARGMTTQEISSHLSKLAIPEKIIEQTREILDSSDVAKFSGGQVERGVIERCYTLFEDILKSNGEASAGDSRRVQEEASKR